MTHPIIFDTDPGIDDAQAIALALRHPEIELLGMTTTYGNVDVETATHNALLLAELAGREIPVAQAAQPMVMSAIRRLRISTEPTAWATSPCRRSGARPRR